MILLLVFFQRWGVQGEKLGAEGWGWEGESERMGKTGAWGGRGAVRT
jgi:hypothetical protein